MRVFFEALPIVLAIVGFAVALERVVSTQRQIDRVFFSLAALCCGLLTLAQSSWLFTLIGGMKFDTFATDVTWTVFNSLVAATFTFAAWTNKHR